jgi:hypothetical protein
MEQLARLRRHLDRLPRERRRWLAVALVAVAVLALAVPVGLSVLGRVGGGTRASGGSESVAGTGSGRDSSGSGSVGKEAAPQAPTEGRRPTPDTSEGGAATGTTGSGLADALPADLGARLARTAWLGVEVGDLVAASARARVVTSEAGGVVTFENVVTAADPTGRYGAPGGLRSPEPAPDGAGDSPAIAEPVGVDEARMVLSVPADKLDGVLTELSRLGSVSYRSSQTEDVTDTYVDARARVQPARDSIARVRALLTKATDLQQVVLLESELSRRQADLDALEQRLAELDRRTTNSDVTLTLWTAATTPVVATTGEDVASRLRGAWEGLLTSATVIVTGLAALLPWLVVLGLVALVVLRVRRRRPAAASPALAAPGGSAGSGTGGSGTGGSGSAGSGSAGSGSAGSGSAGSSSGGPAPAASSAGTGEPEEHGGPATPAPGR